MADSFQKGSIREKRPGTFELRWWEKALDGTWAQKSKTVSRDPENPEKPAIRKHADRELDRILARVNAANGVTTGPSVATFNQLVDLHWDAYCKKQRMVPSTLAGYNAPLQKWIKPFFGDMKLRDITPSVVSQFMGKLGEAELADKYQKNIYNLLTLIFEIARTYDMIVSSPVRPLLHRPSVERKEKDIFPIEKATDFINALPAAWRAPVQVLMLTGMRQGELLGLRWCDIDFTRGFIYKRNVVFCGELMEGQGVKNTAKKDGKAPRKHEVAMGKILRSILESHKDLTLFNKPEDHVFCQADGRPLDPDHMRRQVLYPAMKAVGIEVVRHGSGLHMFRHTAATLLNQAANGNLKLVQEQLGHADIQTTANIYTHLNTEQKQLSANLLEEKLAEVCGIFVV
jgi:integrase